MKTRLCELCNGEAALYCPSDYAFLCWNCDAKVHEANFLVSRHVRRTVCSKCKGFTGNRISGIGFRPLRAICRLCSPDPSGDDSSSSACISSSESCVTPPKRVDFDRRKTGRFVSSSSVNDDSGDCSKFPATFLGEVTSGTRKIQPRRKTTRSQVSSNVDEKAEDIFVNWCRKLGISVEGAARMASCCLGVCLDELKVLPFRVSLAASLWFSLRSCGDISESTCQILKRLEEISGVPAKQIFAAESKLARVLKWGKPRRQQHEPQEEGWAEC